MSRRAQVGRVILNAPLRTSVRRPRGGLKTSCPTCPVCVVTLALLFLALTPLRAHDIYSSFVEARIGEKMEVTVTLARASALMLLPDNAKLPPITPENFSRYASGLREIAPDLLHFSATGKKLPLSSAKVAISGDNDITFTLVFPKPAPGRLRVFAPYLEFLVSNHVATVVLTNPQGDDLGWSPVWVEQPSFEVTLPRPGEKTKPTR